MIRIKNVDSNFEREPLFPYRFKGSFITELWQTAAWLEVGIRHHKIGLGTKASFGLIQKYLLHIQKWRQCIDVCYE